MCSCLGLCFGLKCAPYIFIQLSNFVVRCMHRSGVVSVINYLDDYMIFGRSWEECQHFQQVLIHLLSFLVFWASWHKFTTPSQVVRYLGIIFVSNDLELRLPVDKLESLREELLFFHGKTGATCHQLQCLCGLVAHASKHVSMG